MSEIAGTGELSLTFAHKIFDFVSKSVRNYVPGRRKCTVRTPSLVLLRGTKEGANSRMAFGTQKFGAHKIEDFVCA